MYNYAKDYNLALDRQYIYLDVPSKVSDSMSFTSNEKVHNNIDIKDGMNNSHTDFIKNFYYGKSLQVNLLNDKLFKIKTQ